MYICICITLCRATNDADVRTHPVFDSKLSLEQSKEIALMSIQHQISIEKILLNVEKHQKGHEIQKF